MVISPFNNTNMLWITFPLLLFMILSEMYFGKYSDELLGWNSIVSNSIVFGFVGLDLMRILFKRKIGSAKSSPRSDDKLRYACIRSTSPVSDILP